MSFFWKLVTPFMYLSIAGKKQFDIVLPLIVSTCSVVLFMQLPDYPPILGKNGLVSLGNNFITFLAGFFIASLAAIMTFDRPGLDEGLKGMPAKVLTLQKGNWIRISLTRRRFLAYMFGYLTAISFFLYFYSGMVQILQPNLQKICSPTLYTLFKNIFCWTYVYLLTNIVLTALYGLYYLIERVERT